MPWVSPRSGRSSWGIKPSCTSRGDWSSPPSSRTRTRLTSCHLMVSRGWERPKIWWVLFGVFKAAICDMGERCVLRTQNLLLSLRWYDPERWEMMGTICTLSSVKPCYTQNTTQHNTTKNIIEMEFWLLHVFLSDKEKFKVTLRWFSIYYLVCC